MFIGHFAAGFAAKAVTPKVNLAWLVTAGVLVDVVFTVLVLLDVEHARIVPGFTEANPMDLYDYPWSHSLAAVLAWSLVTAGAWWLWRRDTREAWVMGAVVLSHGVLDALSHVPDMYLWPGSIDRVGLGLWRSVPATVAVEGSLWVAAVALYLRRTRAKDWIGVASLWAFLLLLSGLYAASFVGPPPPDMRTAAYANLVLLPLLAWAGWLDRHRERALGEGEHTAKPKAG